MRSNSQRGCGCALALLLVFAAVVGAGYWRFFRSTETPLPTPSGAELRVQVLDVGQGDAILIISPEGKAVLIDAGDTGRGKLVLEALRRNNVQSLDLFIATHAHPDHIGAADEVLKAIPVRQVLDSGAVPPTFAEENNATTSTTNNTNNRNRSSRATPSPTPTATRRGRNVTRPDVKAYQEFLDVVQARGAEYKRVAPGERYDIGGGAILTVLAPVQPFFTREQMRAGGNEPNANSIVLRLDYGDFSMLLPGDAEAQTEDRLIQQAANLRARVLKVAHHGSRYATSEDFLQRVKPVDAIISCADANRYGHPAQQVLDRLRAANVRVWRTDLQGDITVATRGKQDDTQIKAAHDATGDLYVGRTPERDDSARSGFISYGDFGTPRPKKEGKQ